MTATHAAGLEVSGLMQARKDIKAASQHLGRNEIRYLVSAYYQVQEYRKAAANMALSLGKDEKPCELVSWLAASQERIEKDIQISLDVYARNDPTGAWALKVHGIGPVITAGLLAHIDIERAPTVGHIWSFGGWNPDQVWKKGEKRPWNADLKVLFFKIGDSFMKTSNSPKSFYGPIYRQRKELEVERNERGDFADIAAKTLEERKIRDPDTRKTYEAGKLPAGRLELRARRVAVKLFLAHFHDVLMWNEKGQRAPMPYAFSHMGHAHIIEAPDAPWPASEARSYDTVKLPIEAHKRMLYGRQEGACAGCGEESKFGDLSVVRVDEGGDDMPSNLHLLCEPCKGEAK